MKIYDAKPKGLNLTMRRYDSRLPLGKLQSVFFCFVDSIAMNKKSAKDIENNNESL